MSLVLLLSTGNAFNLFDRMWLSMGGFVLGVSSALAMSKKLSAWRSARCVHLRRTWLLYHFLSLWFRSSNYKLTHLCSSWQFS